MARTILLTGGSGFIASHTILALIKKGYKVRVTVRSIEKVAPISEMITANGANAGALEYAVADLTDDEGWPEAAAGCDGVFHMASPFPLEVPDDPQQLIGPAVDGTLRVLAAAHSAGIRRVVLTSSTAAVAYGQGGRDTLFTEEDWTDPDGKDVTPYVQSKTLAEKAAWKFAEETGLELTAINPGLVLGPLLAPGHGTSVELISMMLGGRMPAAPDMGYNLVDVRDVAAAHIAAFENDAAKGRRFLCCDGWYTLAETGKVIRKAFPKEGRKAPVATLPNFIVRIMALFTPSMKQIVPELGHRRAAGNKPLREVLGIEPISGKDAIIATVNSLLAHK